MGFMGAGTIPETLAPRERGTRRQLPGTKVVSAAPRCHDSIMFPLSGLLVPAVLWTTVIATDPEVRPPTSKVAREAAANDDSLPAFGEHTSAEYAPEVVTRAPAAYPPEAIKAGVQGTVIVSALVGKDGLVKSTRVTTSIPGLDAAAESAVRQWVFKPARNEGKPVAVWVTVPVKFTLHGAPADPVRAAFDSSWTVLRHAGSKPPSEADALLRERTIRLALALAPPVEVSEAAQRHFHRARVVLDSSSTPQAAALALSEMAAALDEAPWWADAYYESAGLLEKAGRPADAAVALDLYLVADPKSTRWETVRRKLMELRGAKPAH
jgi:TonB family protein